MDATWGWTWWWKLFKATALGLRVRVGVVCFTAFFSDFGKLANIFMWVLASVPFLEPAHATGNKVLNPKP